jgi:cytosine/adenosine deaminase-related metal-dependent hydrolase
MKIFAASYLLPVSSPPVEGGAIAVDEGRIIDIGKLSDLRAAYPSEVREFPGCAIIPGFVNAHSHLELTHFPSWKIRKGIDYTPRTYVDWVIQVIKINRGLTRQERELSLREGIRISLESGTTAIGDIITDCSHLNIYGESLISGRLFLEAIGQDPLRCSAQLARLATEIRLFSGSKILPGLSPHAPHTLSETFMKDIAALAAVKAVPMAIHVAESREEMDFLFDSGGGIAELLYPHVGWLDFIPPPRKTTPVEYLEKLGMLNGAPTAIHCVHVTHSDAEILKRHGVRVVLCPRSNEKLDVGRAPAYLFRKMDIPLALGTDSLASNDSLSMQDEMNYVLRNFPGVFTPVEILRMATLGGAGAIGLAHETGTLDKGKRADFLVMKLGSGISSEDVLVRTLIEEGKLMEIAPAGELMLTSPD